jgi:uncharacterized membrane protein YuzA (DUF378 family)
MVRQKRLQLDFKFNTLRQMISKVISRTCFWSQIAYLVTGHQTLITIDYGIKMVTENGEKTTVSLERIGSMPMPIDC